jgi:hypothetical protein
VVVVSRRCTSCSRQFRAEGQWQKLCWRCWRDLNGHEPRGETLPAAPETTVIDERLLLAAVALCHPDRHPPARAIEENRVTRELLAMLDHARRRAA